jgi:hypothetical protein
MISRITLNRLRTFEQLENSKRLFLPIFLVYVTRPASTPSRGKICTFFLEEQKVQNLQGLSYVPKHTFEIRKKMKHFSIISGFKIRPVSLAMCPTSNPFASSRGLMQHPSYIRRLISNCSQAVKVYSDLILLQCVLSPSRNTVKRVDEVVRHQHLVTQDQFTQVSKKVSDIPAEDFTKNIELFLQTFTNVELVRQNWIVSKVTSPGRESRFSNLLSDALPLGHTLFLI